MKGIVTDSVTGRFLSASFKLTEIWNGKQVAHSVSDPVNGEFLICIPSAKSYALVVEKPGYLFYSAHFALEGETGIREPYLHNVRLKPIREGETIVMRNIFFETDSSRLLSESETELNSLFELLTRNPGLRIEISGHTDNTGGEAIISCCLKKGQGRFINSLPGNVLLHKD